MQSVRVFIQLQASLLRRLRAQTGVQVRHHGVSLCGPVRQKVNLFFLLFAPEVLFQLLDVFPDGSVPLVVFLLQSFSG